MSNIPEGATHKATTGFYYKNIDGKWFFEDCYSNWQPSTSSEKWISENLTPLQPTQWLPLADTGCEAKINGAEWIKVKYIGTNTVGSKVYAVVFIPHLSVYDNYKMDDNLEFRPIKTEREKFVEYALNNIVVPCNMDVLKQYLSDLYDEGARFND